MKKNGSKPKSVFGNSAEYQTSVFNLRRENRMGTMNMKFGSTLCLAALLAAQNLSSGQEHIDNFHVTVEAEEEVYNYESANNGSGPMWCHGNTSIVRVGDDVFASGIEVISDAKPLNNCRTFLLHRTNSSWRRIFLDNERTREPSPLAMFNGGQVFLSVNPTLASPDAYSGPAQPGILEFQSDTPSKAPRSVEPAWAENPKFTEHSYRSFVTDGESNEMILLQNIGYAHAEWSFRDRNTKWSAQGKLVWPWGGEYEKPKPIRLCYPAVALKDRRLYFCGEGDITEPNAAWREHKRKATGREWDYVFRRLFYTWSDDITTGKFNGWLEIANREKTAGHLRICDLYVAPHGNVFILWHERALDNQLRTKFFPDAKQRYSLNCTIVRDGKIIQRTTLGEAGDGLGDNIPGQGRFQVTPDNRLFVIYHQRGVNDQGQPISENRIVELDEKGHPDESITIPLEHPIGHFFTATVRAGCKPSNIVDIFGSVGKTMRYARIRIN